MADCPQPRKVRHKTIQAALAHRDYIDRAEGIDKDLKPYWCVGGHYHLGHKPGSGKGGLNGKIKRALGARR